MDIAAFLQLSDLREARLIAGEKGIDRRIGNVKMMDAPDIIHYLTQDDLLVTTAYHYVGKPELLLDLIKEMKRIGCAGLGIKQERFLGQIPKSVLAYAKQVDFPIIALPEQLGLSYVANQVLSTILDQRTHELTTALDAHRAFSEHIVSGKGLLHLVENVAQLVGAPILLMNERCQVISASNSANPVGNGMEYLYRMGYAFFPEGSPYTSFTLLMNQPKTVTAFPVYTDKAKKSILVILNSLPSHDRQAYLLIEQATNVIAFELMKENALKQYTRRAKNEFFLHYINGQYATKDETINRAQEFGLYNDRPYKCVAGRLDQEETSLGFKENHIEIEKVFDFVEEELSIFPFQSHLFIKGDICFVLLEGEKDDTIGDSLQAVDFALEMIQEHVFLHFKRSISFGVSHLCRQFWDVREAHQEATNALHSGRLSGSRQFVQTYQAKDLVKLLRMIPREDLNEFCDYNLKKLTEPSVNEMGLIQTLAVYLETHCQISETAKRLYVHRNTIIYRLEKIEELLGKNLKDPDTTLHLRLALRIQHTLQTM
ncbi:PucR family transcriptional regulator [Shouchella sp. JSM 1781072]|uniref:PucR family transcriptional regulator n=1 Tax=Shouchella sp. JSM 1781072 TaxID=3344581 RepID=UPI0035BF4216